VTESDIEAHRHPRANVIVAATAGLVAVVVALVVAVAVSAQPMLFSEPRQRAVQQATIAYGEQAVLPFGTLDHPAGLAVDAADNLYVSDGSGRILKLAAGEQNPIELMSNLPRYSFDIAADATGNVYVVGRDDSISRIDAQSHARTRLPFTGLDYPEGIAVDSDGTVYITDNNHDRVLASMFHDLVGDTGC